MSLMRVAIVSADGSASFSELTRVSAAIQEQVMRDFAPLWGIQASVSPFEKLEDVPTGTCPIIITGYVPRGSEGAQEDAYGHPIAFIEHDVDLGWALMASHACIEMLADPYGNRMVPAQSPMAGQSIAEFLVEPCDPCKDADFAYVINGVTVSDFCTPSFYDSFPVAGGRYDFIGKVKEPRSVLQNGYLSWRDPVSDEWFQQTWFNANPQFVQLGKIASSPSQSCRTRINSITKAYSDVSLNEMQWKKVNEMQKDIQAARVSKADAWRLQLNQLLK